MIILFLIKESFLYAINSLIVNRLRTFLSLIGITIGIFAIISVFTVIDSLENSIKNSIAKLGDNVVYVQKWPWAFGGDYPWWEYMKRPVPKLDEKDMILNRSLLTHSAAFIIYFQRTVKYYDRYTSNTQIVAASAEYENIRTFEIAKGRYFSPFESAKGRNKVILGYTLAEQLFQNEDPIGKEIKIGGHKVVVIGVFQKEGDDMFGMSPDEEIHMPINYARNFVNLRDEKLSPMIMVKAKKNIHIEELIDELEGVMRSVRRLKPSEKINFALNKASVISEGFKGLFKIIDLAGIIIGGFSILVGGFGIANIMFVSVKEQTKIIGIQKAIGAKRYFIMLQFLYEAVILSLVGGLLGLLLIYLLVILLSSVSGMNFELSTGNILWGVGISITVGILSGFIPAYNASRLDPVEAINSN